MKTVYFFLSIVLLLATVSAFAHHPTADILDAEIYDMIDSMVADTPHAELDFDDSQSGMVETTITTRTARSLESMMSDGLLTTISLLDGDVSVSIEFDDRGGATLTVTQILE
ncbi:hypothetical protein [Desulfosarcina sp.]|uniref:hypothetical protein n=1 Tax=Desulfosarcina sp. TaxID=2027861 RepID=UPI0029BAC05A|nr:hypothetical protein [Desulfosarcina sp.]MDX2452315.1 hypothetical protein [Desulfosarcina sp.]MDX2490095.1 hypothetical protein [Desulfosarcina sp.]